MRLGYVVIDCIRPAVWTRSDVDICYRQNVFLYAKSSELYRYPELQDFYLKHRDATILDVVHPEMWISRLVQHQNAFNQMQAELARLNRA